MAIFVGREKNLKVKEQKMAIHKTGNGLVGNNALEKVYCSLCGEVSYTTSGVWKPENSTHTTCDHIRAEYFRLLKIDMDAALRFWEKNSQN